MRRVARVEARAVRVALTAEVTDAKEARSLRDVTEVRRRSSAA